MTMMRIARNPWLRIALVLSMAAAVFALLWWRGPEWGVVVDAFQLVRWQWIVAAVGLNLLSIVVRAVAWHTVIHQAMPPPHPRFRLTFSAFGVGLLANAVLPGRIGEFARVAVLNKRLPPLNGRWATLVGTVFAHRLFDLFPALGLVVYVLLTARIPHWAVTSLTLAAGVGVGLLAFGFVSARRHSRSIREEWGTPRRIAAMARNGLGVLHAPVPAIGAMIFQGLGWLCQFFAVYTAMRGFHIHLELPAAGLVLVLMNIATIFPLWPGNIGLLQAAIALPLVHYGVPYGRGFAFGIGLQAIEASVGIGIGLLFLAREGLSFAILRRMPPATEGGEEEAEEEAAARESAPSEDGARARTRVTN